jgi:hypothetical protein
LQAVVADTVPMQLEVQHLRAVLDIRLPIRLQVHQLQAVQVVAKVEMVMETQVQVTAGMAQRTHQE